MTNEYREALQYMEDMENPLDIFDTLDAIDEELKEKAERIGDVIRSYQSEAELLKAESKRLKERADKRLKEAEALIKYVAYNMDQAGFAELKGLKHTFKFSDSVSLECTNIEKVPKHFQKTKVEPDIAGFKAHIKQQYEERGIKLVTKYSAKPKGIEMKFDELDLEELGLQFVSKRKLNLK